MLQVSLLRMAKIFLLFLASFAILAVVTSKYNISFNQSPSLKGKLFLISKNSLPKEYNDIIIFKAIEDFQNKENNKYPTPHKSKLKKVIGFEGDIVSVRVPTKNKTLDNKIPSDLFPHQQNFKHDNQYHIYINNKDYGIIKPQSLKGEPLQPITTLNNPTTIPKDHYFVYTPHKDSYDSRYKSIGLIHKSQIIGRAYEIL